MPEDSGSNLYKLYRASLSFTSDEEPVDIANDINKITINRNINNYGTFFTIELVTNKFTFIPPQSIIVLEIIDFTGAEKKTIGLAGVVWNGSGMLPVDVGDQYDRTPITFSFIDVWSVLSTSEILEFSLENANMDKCLEEVRNTLSQIETVYSFINMEDIDFQISEAHNVTEYENLYIPGLVYLETLKSLSRNYGIYKNALLMYSESTVTSFDKISRTTIITNIKDIIDGVTEKQVKINIGEPSTKNEDEDDKNKSFTITRGSVDWDITAEDSLSIPSIMQYRFADEDVFWNNPAEITSDGDELGENLEYSLRIKKVGVEMAPARTANSLLARLDNALPWVTLTLKLPRWDWESFRPTTRAIVKYNENLNKIDSKVIDGNWCIAQNNIVFDVEAQNMALSVNEVILLKHYLSTPQVKTQERFDPSKTNF